MVNNFRRFYLCMITDAYSMDNPPFLLFVCIFIVNNNSLLFHLFFIFFTCSLPWPCNLMIASIFRKRGVRSNRVKDKGVVAPLDTTEYLQKYKLPHHEQMNLKKCLGN